MAFKDIEDIHNTIGNIVNNDCLDAFICFSTHYVLILNPNKSENKKGKFLFIDKSDAGEDPIKFGRPRQSDLFSNYQFYLFNTQSALTLTELDKKYMEDIIELYRKYEDSDFSIIIENEDFDEETLELLLI